MGSCVCVFCPGKNEGDRSKTMNATLRKTVWLFACLSFVYVASGPALSIHLLTSQPKADPACTCAHCPNDSEDEQDARNTPSHDSGPCPICQFLLAHAQSTCLVFAASIIEPVSQENVISSANESLIQQFIPLPSLPRGPPV